MNEKVALITGVTGQDGAYLARLLLEKGYIVHGVKRRSSSFNTGRVDDIYTDWHDKGARFFLHYGDVTDAGGIVDIIARTKPTEIYNLAGQSHVLVSFEAADYTSNVNALGALRILEAVRLLGRLKDVRFYQASTSELYGGNTQTPQNEDSAFIPCSPYAIAKLYAYWTTKLYRDTYGVHASNGILFNHESPLRGETFVTRKITRAAAAIVKGKQSILYLGNLDARRDWGHARDFVEGMWRMLQQPHGDDYVLATGEQHSVRELAEKAFACAGRPIVWDGRGLAEVGRCARSGQVLIEIDPRYFRPSEVHNLLGDASKAHRLLGWRATTRFDALVEEMVRADLDAA